MARILSCSDADLSVAAKLIRDGGVVGIPTETVYGLAANALDVDAVSRIFALKGRPADNPLIVHIADVDDVYDVAHASDVARRLMDAFMPGPFTIVLPRKSAVPDVTTGGLDTVAIRCPSHAVARRIIGAAGVPVAAPSANTSGKPSPTAAMHVVHDFGDRLDAIVDGGVCDIGLESTVVTIIEDAAVILRQGAVTAVDLSRVCAVREDTTHRDKPISPGTKYRHYAPTAPVHLYHDRRQLPTLNDNTAVIAYRDSVIDIDGHTFVVGDNEEYARSLYDILRRCDDMEIACIYAVEPRDDGLCAALRDRLGRIATPNPSTR